MADSYQIGQDHTADPAATVLRPHGELDINSRDDLHAMIVDALGTAGRIVVDLADVTFLDSEALGALIDGYNATLAVGVGFRVVNAQAGVARVLNVSGAQELFDS
ncbi:STAS domain-containing protein [Actinoplanes sp. Pm04-4]|uniref:Anti-sigma factor antagonist n=1 Tax=Paractinoplanes pyxinae TaxID=2997416 RepID=A0ABT4ATJ7_9ACTN|nr:STAS domain-containing protein [Actinoplanes pyxinae]MCY1137574.1 STAS domain-containing protein [Actinoplanes pyxinae]